MTSIGGTSFGVPSTTKKKKPNQKRKKKKPAQAQQIQPQQPIKKPKKSDSSLESSEEEEGIADYRKGGYHPVELNTIYNRKYKIISKLGWGHFSTVWLVENVTEQDKFAALKIVKSASHYTEAAVDEIEILNKIAEKDTENKKCTIRLLDNFEKQGPNGNHICMVFERLGSNLLDLIKRFKYRGIPIPIVKKLTKQLLISLDFIHTECNIIHTDVKPENILLYRKITLPYRKSYSGSQSESKSVSENETKNTDTSEPTNNSEGTEQEETIENESENSDYVMGDEEPPPVEEENEDHEILIGTENEEISVNNPDWRSKLCDLGNACWTNKHFTDEVQTRQYRSPEVILGIRYTTAIDIWSVACVVFELATGDLLFKPKKGKNYGKADDHLAQIIELLGRIPKQMASSGKHGTEFFNRKGELKAIPAKDLSYWPLKGVFERKYKFDSETVNSLCSFLLPMLQWNPEKRVTARQALQHEFLANVEV